MNFLLVALGGAVGAVGRYAISLIPTKNVFPILTLMTNLAGAVLIGFIVGILDTKDNANLFWKTGVCGGFTTFSTFSLEAYQLFESRNYGLAVLYIVLSVSLCLLGVFCGKRLAALVG